MNIWTLNKDVKATVKEILQSKNIIESEEVINQDTEDIRRCILEPGEVLPSDLSLAAVWDFVIGKYKEYLEIKYCSEEGKVK